jgi:molecular chaperone GrpE
LSQFVALRHDVSLQTKAARAQQEQASRSLDALEQALESLQDAHGATHEVSGDASADAARPLIKSLLEALDLLTVAGREVKRVRDLLETCGRALVEPIRQPCPRPTLLQRLFGGVAAQKQGADAPRSPDASIREAWGKVCQLVDGVLAGYTMSLERLNRTLKQFGVEPIVAEGETFDPEMMEAVEAVAGTGLAAATIVQEVRRGYLWHGRVFRCAQVKVAR